MSRIVRERGTPRASSIGTQQGFVSNSALTRARSFRTMQSSHMLRQGGRAELVWDDMGHVNIHVTRSGGRHQMRGSVAQESIVAVHG